MVCGPKLSKFGEKVQYSGPRFMTIFSQHHCYTYDAKSLNSIMTSQTNNGGFYFSRQDRCFVSFSWGLRPPNPYRVDCITFRNLKPQPSISPKNVSSREQANEIAFIKTLPPHREEQDTPFVKYRLGEYFKSQYRKYHHFTYISNRKDCFDATYE